MTSLAPPRSYEVLYYKRSNKVQKKQSKTAVKMDGILVLSPPPSCHATLRPIRDDETDRVVPVFSGVHRDATKRAFASPRRLQVDDVVSLGPYDCQIGNIVGEEENHGNHDETRTGTKASKVPTTAAAASTTKNKRPPLRPALVSKQPRRGLGTTSNTSTCITSRMSSSSFTARKPPTQPKRRSFEVSKSDDTSDDDETGPMAIAIRSTVSNRHLSSKQQQQQQLLVKHRPPLRRFVPPKRKRTSSSSSSSLVHNTSKRTSIDTNTSRDTTIILPPSVQKSLQPHQVQGVHFLWNCLTGQSEDLERILAEQRHEEAADVMRGAILADQMGLGKTLMTICLIFAMHRRNPTHRFIVVCPSSLTTNWTKEFDKWITRASQPKRVVVQKGGQEGVQQIQAFCTVKPRLAEVLIISYDLFRRNASLLQHAKPIGLLVVDEGHKLKNSAGSLTLTALQQLQCHARLSITGTPIQNNLTEFHTVANFVCPGILGDLATFRRVYERPIAAANSKTATREQRARGHEQSKKLDAITSAFMLRRLQKDILQLTLPPRHELLLFCRPSRVQCEMYRRIANRGSRNVARDGGATAEALTVLTSLRKLCCHPLLAQNTDKDNVAVDDVSQSGKLQILSALLVATKKFCPTDKVVIVSNFTSALSVIEETILKPREWPYHRLDGSTAQSDRQSAVDSFNRATTDKAFAFLLSSKAGGCGLNMIGANRLVMFDADYNPATDAQAMARIYRQGQTKPCYVYRLFSTGTIEEVVFQRQIQKDNLASLTVDGSSSKKAKSTGFTKEELRDCFTLKEDCACDTKRKLGNKWPEYEGSDDAQLAATGDRPLMTIAGSHSKTLTFIHVVEESEENDGSCDEQMEESAFDDKSSDEEFEFGDDCSEE